MSRSSLPAGSDHSSALAVRRRLSVSLSGALLTLPLAALAQSETGTNDSMDTMVVVGTALKVDAPALETPRSTSVVTEEDLEKRAVKKLDEAFRYRSGVLSSPYGSDNNTDWLFLRGFNAEDSTYQDGLRLFREGGYFWWMTEPFGLERIEVLKGPASILYGEAPPGGVINGISKRPTEDSRGLFEIEGGSDDHQQVGIDTSGPVTENGDIRYRMVGLFRKGDGEIDYTDNERIYLAPSLAVDFSENTSITFLGSYMKDDGVPSKGFRPVEGSLYDTPFGRIDRHTNLGEPDYERSERTQVSLGYEFEHIFNNTWTFQQNFRYSELDLLLRLVAPGNALGADGRTTTRSLTYRDGEYDAFTVDNRMVGKWFTANTENTLLVGVDYQKFDVNYGDGDNFGFSPIDVFDPEYGNFTPSSNLYHAEESKEQVGVYVQDQLRLHDRWILLAGVRHDSADINTYSERYSTNSDTSEDQLSFSGGVMYLGDYGISPYLSYSESFNPQVGRGPDGRAYVPSEGEQWEAGIKYAPSWLDGYISAAIFDLKETNTLYTSGESASRQGGERHSRGFELEGIGYLTDQLQLTAAYTYIDTRIDISTEQTNLRAGLIPRHQASVWLDYGFEDGLLNGLSLGGGVRYVGESVDLPQYSDNKVPSYTLYDAKASYDINRSWVVQVNVNNLTDEEYVSGCNFWCYYGESRSVIGSLSYRW